MPSLHKHIYTMNAQRQVEDLKTKMRKLGEGTETAVTGLGKVIVGEATRAPVRRTNHFRQLVFMSLPEETRAAIVKVGMCLCGGKMVWERGCFPLRTAHLPLFVDPSTRTHT